jgi:hypothetical protein
MRTLEKLKSSGFPELERQKLRCYGGGTSGTRSLSLTELNSEELENINGGNTLAWWEALGDAIGAMNRARSAYAISQATSLYQSILLGGREAGVFQM